MKQKRIIPIALFTIFQLAALAQDHLNLFWYEAMAETWLNYSFLKPFNKDLAQACKNGKCGLIDINGQIVIPLEYENLYPLSTNTNRDGYELFVVYHEDYLQPGVIDIKGNLIVPMAYNDLRLIDDGRIVACDDRGNCHVYLENGKEVTAEVFRRYKCKADIKNGLVPASEDGVHYGLIDEKGEWLVTPRYFGFEESKGALWFCFNGIGRVQIVNPAQADWECPKFGKVVGFDDGSFLAQQKEGWYVYDASCNPMGKKQGIDSLANYPTILGSPAIFMFKGKYGLISEGGKTLLESKFKLIQIGHGQPDWYFIVTNDEGRVGIFYNNQWVVPCEFEQVQYRSEYGYFAAVRGDSTIIFDKNGEWRASLPFKVLLGQMGQYFYDGVNKRYAWSPKTGLINLPEGLKSISGLAFMLVFETLDGKSGAIGTNGEQLFSGYDVVAQNAYVGKSDFCFIRKDSLWGMADQTMKYIIQPQYSKLEQAGLGVFLARKGNKVGYVNYKNELLLPIEFDDYRVTGNFLELKKDGRWAIYDRKTYKQITAHKFRSIEFKPGCFAATTEDNKWRLFDMEGKELGDGVLESYPKRLRDGYFTTEKNGLDALYSPNGKKLTDHKYASFSHRWSKSLVNDRFVLKARTPEGVNVYLDGDGMEILKADGLWIAPNGAFAAQQDGQWRFYDRDGRPLTNLALLSFSGGLTFPGIWGFGKDQNGIWHVLDWAGKSIFSIAADQVKEYENPSPPNDLVMEKDGGRFLIRLYDFSVVELGK